MSAAKTEAPAGGTARGFTEQATKYSVDFASDDAHGKALATMQARATLCGCNLYELGDGGFLVCRCGYSTAVPCLRAVGNLLRQIGAR